MIKMVDIKNYKPLILGKFTKFEAGVIYRAVKENKITVLPETIKTLYDSANQSFGYYSECYSQDHDYYDRIYLATEYILNEEYKKAQYELNVWQDECIRLSGKKSIFFKYKK